jgi:hypothetical protein
MLVIIHHAGISLILFLIPVDAFRLKVIYSEILDLSAVMVCITSPALLFFMCEF